MSLEKAVQLLSSNDVTNQRNGCALVINNAATAANVNDIIKANILSLLIPMMNSPNDDLKMRICWVVNNLCVHEAGREAVNNSNIINGFPDLLTHKPRHTETIQKISWALTNLARLPNAMRKITSSGTFAGLIEVLKDGDDDQRAAVVQPLCNLVLNDPTNQEQFRQKGGLKPAIQLMDAKDQKVRELAVTLISFVGSNHDSIRNAMLHEGVLKHLNKILNGDGTEKMQELALNALVALSLSSEAENAIMEQGTLKPVVGLLSSNVESLREQAAMLLSNLLTNDDVRKHIRYLSWCDPMANILQTGNQNSVCQVTRCIVNITFDEHCRYMCVKSGMAAKLKSAAGRVRSSDVDELSKTACSNMEVGVSGDVQREVDDALKNGRVTKVSAPTSSLKEKKVDDFAGLDDLIGTNTNPNYKTGGRAQAKPTSSALDDLDSLLDGPSSKPKPVSQPVSKPVSQPVSQPAKKPNTAAAFDDLDDLLNAPTPTPKPQPKPQAKFDDLDDLLSGITPSNNKPAPKTQVRNDDFDDLDSLLGNTKPAAKPQAKPKSNDMDDIDSLLADMQPPSKAKPSSHQNDDIDSLLADLGNNTKRGAAKSSNEIDDLLADLM